MCVVHRTCTAVPVFSLDTAELTDRELLIRQDSRRPVEDIACQFRLRGDGRLHLQLNTHGLNGNMSRRGFGASPPVTEPVGVITA